MGCTDTLYPTRETDADRAPVKPRPMVETMREVARMRDRIESLTVENTMLKAASGAGEAVPAEGRGGRAEDGAMFPDDQIKLRIILDTNGRPDTVLIDYDSKANRLTVEGEPYPKELELVSYLVRVICDFRRYGSVRALETERLNKVRAILAGKGGS